MPLLRWIFDLYDLRVIALRVVYKEKHIFISFVCSEELFVKNVSWMLSFHFAKSFILGKIYCHILNNFIRGSHVHSC